MKTMTMIAIRMNGMRAMAAGIACAVLFAVAGCGSIDTTPGGDPNRVLEGAVNFSGSIPTGAEIVVRVVEPPSSEPARVGANDLPVAAPTTVERVDRVLGETKVIVSEAATKPVGFRVEFQAGDAVLRRGVNVDVRVSVGGKVRMRTVSAHAVTLRSAGFKQEVWVQNVQ